MNPADLKLPTAVREQHAAALAEFEKANAPEGNTESPAPEALAAQGEAVAAESAPQPDPPPAADTVDWKHKFDVLKGKYDAEVPRLAEEVRRLTELVQRAPAPPPPVPAPTAPPASGITAEEAAQHGFDPATVEFLRKTARDALAPELSAIEKAREVVPQVERIAADQARTAQERHVAALTEKVSDWQALWNSEAFQTWLDEKDMRGPLEGADSAHNVKRMATIFDNYKREHPAATPAPKSAAADKLKAQVEPERRAAPAPAEAAKITPEAFRKAGEDFVKHRISEKDYRAIEAEYMRQQAGR